MTDDTEEKIGNILFSYAEVPNLRPVKVVISQKPRPPQPHLKGKGTPYLEAFLGGVMKTKVVCYDH